MTAHQQKKYKLAHGASCGAYASITARIKKAKHCGNGSRITLCLDYWQHNLNIFSLLKCFASGFSEGDYGILHHGAEYTRKWEEPWQLTHCT